MVKMKMILNMITAWVKELFRRIRSLALAKRSTAVIMTAVMLLSVVSAVVIPQVNKSSAMEDGLTNGKIISFESYNPVFDAEVEEGTTVSNIGLPETLRAEMELDGEYTFKQTQPIPSSDGNYDYYQYGYVIDKNNEAKYKAGDLVLYTIIYANGTNAYRVHGTMDGKNEGFYACDKDGNITGVIYNIPVTWNTKKYDAEKTGDYTFKAVIEGYKYSGSDLEADVTVVEKAANSHIDDSDNCGAENMETCTCSLNSNEFSSSHSEDCPLYRPDCNCSVENTEYSDKHAKTCPYYEEECHCVDVEKNGHNPSCPYYVPTAEGCTCDTDANCYPWQHDESCPCFREIELTDCTCEGGYENHDDSNSMCPLYTGEDISTQSINGGGATDVATDTYMRTRCPTSGNATITTPQGLTIPGVWSNYLNTIWMNKAYNKFYFTPVADVHSYNNWVWSGTIANQTTGTVTTNQRRIPTLSSGTWNVYSGEQLYYALQNYSHGNIISIKGNLNLNGSNYSWNYIDKNKKSICNIYGNDYTIYNMCSYSSDGKAGFFGNTRSSTQTGNLLVTNLHFVSAKVVSYMDSALFHSLATQTGYTATTKKCTFTNVTAENCLSFSSINDYNCASSILATHSMRVNYTSCYTKSCFAYGFNHVNMFASLGGCTSTAGIEGDTLINCFGVDNLDVGRAGHSSLFYSCGNVGLTMNNCFSAGEIYGCDRVSGFVTQTTYNSVKNSFSTGKVEAYSLASGFMTTCRSAVEGVNLSNCYTTCLVGMRKQISNTPNLGGFTAGVPSFGSLKLTKCYAAGEVGNFDTDMNNPLSIGGFANNTDAVASATYCYYDKQTTAMREWTLGSSKTFAGITGLLTTTTAKGGVGMASGSNFGLGTTDWKYEAGHYPQLKYFSSATAANWIDANRANIVKAYSEASVSTVFLDTWDKGYDWSDDGVRTKVETSYDRTLASTGKTAHKGYELTYDTVREIVTDFTATDADAYSGATWTEMVPGGTLTNASGTNSRDTIKIMSDGTGEVHNPGLNWYKVSTNSSGQVGYRPLRLIAYMDVNAGADKTVQSGSMYNHRADVSLNMMDTLTDNLVVGIDDNTVWSNSKIGGYPTKSDTDSSFTNEYYAMPTDHTNNMLTNFTASKDAWLYTEIWTAERSGGGYAVDPYGNYVPEFSVYVTGAGTGGNTTDDEKKWNGEYPMSVDTSTGKKYIITYYWMLKDGRYRTDTKYIDIIPGKFDLHLNVFNFRDDTDNNTALYLGTSKDYVASPMDYNTTVSNDLSSATTTSNTSSFLDSPLATNVSASWKKEMDVTTVDKIRITMKTTDGNTVGTKTVTLDDGTGVIDGTEITVPILYTYLTYVYDAVQDANREVTRVETVNVTYKVVYDTAKGQYDLQFAKIWNTLPGETEILGDDEGIPPATLATINDICYDTFVDLWVSEVEDFKVQKTLSTPAEENEVFMFRADFCGNGSTAGAVESTQYVRLNIAAGDSSAIANFKDMPLGWYKVTELDSNWRFDLTDNLVTLNPTANSVNDSTITYFLGTPITGGGVFTFKFNDERKDTPWAHGKTDIVNELPETATTVASE